MSKNESSDPRGILPPISKKEGMEIYDSLPPEVRKLMREAIFSHDPRYYREFVARGWPLSKIIAATRYAEEAYLKSDPGNPTAKDYMRPPEKL